MTRGPDSNHRGTSSPCANRFHRLRRTTAVPMFRRLFASQRSTARPRSRWPARKSPTCLSTSRMGLSFSTTATVPHATLNTTTGTSLVSNFSLCFTHFNSYSDPPHSVDFEYFVVQRGLGIFTILLPIFVANRT